MPRSRPLRASPRPRCAGRTSRRARRPWRPGGRRRAGPRPARRGRRPAVASANAASPETTASTRGSTWPRSARTKHVAGLGGHGGRAGRRAGCAGRSRRSSVRRHRRRPSTGPAAGRRRRRRCRAIGSRRSSRSARPCATAAGRRPPGGRRGRGRGLPCGCSGTSTPTAARSSRTWAGLRRSSTPGPGRAAALPVAVASGRGGLGLGARPRARGVGDERLGARAVDRQAVALELHAQQGSGRLGVHRGDQARPGRVRLLRCRAAASSAARPQARSRSGVVSQAPPTASGRRWPSPRTRASAGRSPAFRREGEQVLGGRGGNRARQVCRGRPPR